MVALLFSYSELTHSWCECCVYVTPLFFICSALTWVLADLDLRFSSRALLTGDLVTAAAHLFFFELQPPFPV